MINSEKIIQNISKFKIYTSHNTIFESILKVLNEDRNKIVIRGEMLSGKSFFCQKLALELIKIKRINQNKIKIIDLPLEILKYLKDKEIKNINFDIIKQYVNDRNINDIIKYQAYDIIILDDINDIIFADLLKLAYSIEKSQILIQVIDDNLYYTNVKEYLDQNFSVFHLTFPSLIEIKEMLERYFELFQISKINIDNLTKDKFKSLIS